MADSHPPLLPAGLHPKTLDELECLCVTDFPLSTRRPMLMQGLRKMVTRLDSESIEGDLLTDGSFLTQKLEPNDVDVALEVSETFLKAANSGQQVLLSYFGSNDGSVRADIHRDFLCHTFVFCPVPVGHPWHGGTDMKAYWHRQFGRDRAGNAKGIGVLAIGGGVK